MSTTRKPTIAYVAAVVLLASCPLVRAQDELTKEQKRQFLLTAKVVHVKQSSKGVTGTQRLTLSDGQITHEGSFQSIDEHKARTRLANGTVELNFADSYKYDIAAYLLAEMLGIDDLMPVTVERKWQGETGSLTWWLPVVMDEAERLKRKTPPPDMKAWNRQVFKVRVLNELIYDADPNQTNLLIGKDWQIWRIDYSRGFRTHKKLRAPGELVSCERHLFENLKKLTAAELEQKTKRYLTKTEREAVMVRRDLIVQYFEKLIAEKSESAVLY